MAADSEEKTPAEQLHELIDRLLTEAAHVFPVQFDSKPVGLTFAVAAAARCCTFLEAMQLLVRAGAPEGCGVLLRSMFETFLAGQWALHAGDEAYTALARSDYAWEQRHRKAIGMPRTAWIGNETIGDDTPQDSERLGPKDMKQRAAAALRVADKSDTFIHDGYNQIFGPESWLSTHTTTKSLEGHFAFDETPPVLTLRNSSAATDETWRLPMAFVMTAGLLHEALDELGVSTPEFKALAAADLPQPRNGG